MTISLPRAIAESENVARQSAQREKDPIPGSTATGNSKAKGKMPEVVILDDSDTEEEPAPPKRTAHASNGNKANGKSVVKTPSATRLPVSTANEPAPAIAVPALPTSTFLLDRQALERERLERQKRLRGDVNAPQSSSDEEESQESEGAGVGDRRDAKRRKVEGPPAGTSQASAASAQAGPMTGPRNPASASRPEAKSSSALFLDGEVRPTWNRFVHDGRKRFRIEEIIGDVSRLENTRIFLRQLLQKNELALVIAASYCHESEWISRNFPDPALVPTIHIRQPQSKAENDNWAMEMAEAGGGLPGTATVWAFMSNPGIRGTMHMKFMLVSITAKVRKDSRADSYSSFTNPDD